MKIGFIGLGDQGGPMAEMILKAGLELTVWARRPEVLPHFTSLGAEYCGQSGSFGGKRRRALPVRRFRR